MPGRGPSVLPGAESCGPTGLRMGLAAMLPGPAPTPEAGRGLWDLAATASGTSYNPQETSTPLLPRLPCSWLRGGGRAQAPHSQEQRLPPQHIAGASRASTGVTGRPPVAALTWKGCP